MTTRMTSRKIKPAARRAATKASVKKRTVNQQIMHPQEAGAPFNDQDMQRRLGNFVGAGEHARKGGRTSGIVGQTTKKLHTDQRKKG